MALALSKARKKSSGRSAATASHRWFFPRPHWAMRTTLAPMGLPLGRGASWAPSALRARSLSGAVSPTTPWILVASSTRRFRTPVLSMRAYLFISCFGHFLGCLGSALTLCLPGRFDLFFSEGAQELAPSATPSDPVRRLRRPPLRNGCGRRCWPAIASAMSGTSFRSHCAQAAFSNGVAFGL